MVGKAFWLMKAVEMVWQILNAAILLVAFAAPWFPVSLVGEILNGFQVVDLLVFSISYDIVDFGAFFSSIPSYLLPAGLACIWAYVAVVLVRVFAMTQLEGKWWLSTPLVLGAVAMLCLTVLVSRGYDGLNRCRWGYWFTWVGLASSIMSESASRRLHCWRSESSRT
jgi:hypothetical protein